MAVLVLGDGRFPAGGHAHSAGIEAAVLDGRVDDPATLEAFVRGRLATVGHADAALAAATVARVVAAPSAALGLVLVELDAEADARIAAPPVRAASRRLGRQLLRVAGRCWPDGVLVTLADLLRGGAHYPVAFGVVGVAAGLGPGDVARLVLHHAAATPAQAAVRLLGLDPFEVAALLAGLAPVQEALVELSVASAASPLRELPAGTGPVCDIAALDHAGRETRMFVT